MSQGQWEQHQPVKSSPSTLIKRLFIQPYLCVRLGFELGRDGWNNINRASAEGELLPVATSNFPQSLRETK
jgi:hypothetical protein